MDVAEAAGRPDKSVMLYTEQQTQAEIDAETDTIDAADRELKNQKIASVANEIKKLRDDISSKSEELRKTEQRVEQGKMDAKGAEGPMKQLSDDIAKLKEELSEAELEQGQMLGAPADGKTARTAPVPPELGERRYKTPTGKAKAAIRQQTNANKRLFDELKLLLMDQTAIGVKKNVYGENKDKVTEMLPADLVEPIGLFKTNFSQKVVKKNQLILIL